MSRTSELNIETLKRMSNAIRVLAAEGVQKANSGHPGMPMGCLLYTSPSPRDNR